MPVRIELDRPPQTIDGAHVSAEVEVSQADDELPVREEWIARAQADGLCDIRLGLPRSSQAELHEPGVDVRLHKIAVEANGELKLTERPVRHAHGEQQSAIAEMHRALAGASASAFDTACSAAAICSARLSDANMTT